MGKSQETWNKKEKEKKKQRKKNEKEQKKQDRKAEGKSSFDDMIAYVDEFGNISSTPPDPSRKSKVKLEDIEVSIPKQAPIDPADLIRKGSVTFFNDAKGYGFIKDQESQESIFVHANGLLEPIKEKDKVSFEVEMGQKGPNAVRVKIVKPE